MKIIVDGKEAVMKEGSSFEYHSENPLFTEAEDYSFDIEFPMKDCPQNILIFGALHVKCVDISTVTFPCEIITESFDKTGFLTITEVNDSSVKGQFLEGMSTQGWNNQGWDLYIDEIDFSEIDGTDGNTTFVLDDNGFADLPVWDKDNEAIFELKGQPLNKHIYLWNLVDWIAFKANVEVDYTGLDDISWFQNLVVCNTTDHAKYVSNVFDSNSGVDRGFYFMDIEKTLPHWTVREFFENLALLFGCKVMLNNQKRVVKFEPLKNLIKSDNKVALKVSDDFTIEFQDSERKVDKASKVKFPDECSPGNINNCMWIYDYLENLKIVKLIDPNQYNPAWLAQNPYADDIYYRKSRLYDCLDDISGVYAAITEIEKRDDVTQYGNELHFVRFEVLNQFASDKDAEELKIFPANLEWKRLRKLANKWQGLGRNQYGRPEYVDTEASFSNPYKMPVMSIIKYTPAETLDNAWYFDAGDLIDKGIPNAKVDNIQLVLFARPVAADGSHINTRQFEPVIGTEYAQETITATEGIVPDYYTGIKYYSDMISPDMPEVSEQRELPSVDESKLYRYKFLSSTIPDPKAIFVIRGKEYACQKITAHFKVDGMSEELEGEFYEITG